MHQLIRPALAALAALPALLAPASAAQAATRSYIVTDFDRVRLEAPIAVAIQSGRGIAARGEGDAELLERIELRISGGRLTIRFKSSPFGNRGASAPGAGARLFLTVPSLRGVDLVGAGTLAVTGLRGQKAEIMAAGSGSLSVADIKSATLSVAQRGSGLIRLSGEARTVDMNLAGNGTLDAQALEASDLNIAAEGAGMVEAAASRSARIVAVGPVGVTVTGLAACTVRHAGSGTVLCGDDAF